MQTLVFNTTERKVKVYKDIHCKYQTSDCIYEFENVPTVKVLDGFYEVMQEENNFKYPVLRVPISNTNMIIEK